MKNLFIIVATFVSLNAFAGHEFGNGGGVVVCRRPVLKTIKSVELLDFYEARSLRGLTIDLGDGSRPWKEQVQFVLANLRHYSEFRFQLYSRWLETFEKEALFMPDAEFSTVPDSHFVALPNGCSYEQAVIQRAPLYPGDARYYVNAKLWDKMTERDRAGLVLHEMVYREAIGWGHTDSIRARYLTALFSSHRISVVSSIEPALSLQEFVDALRLSHFEATDLPIQHEGFSSEVDVSSVWSKGAGESDPEPIQMKDRVFVKLGTCKGSSCNDFQEVQNFGLDESGKYLWRSLLHRLFKLTYKDKLGQEYLFSGTSYLSNQVDETGNLETTNDHEIFLVSSMTGDDKGVFISGEKIFGSGRQVTYLNWMQTNSSGLRNSGFGTRVNILTDSKELEFSAVQAHGEAFSFEPLFEVGAKSWSQCMIDYSLKDGELTRISNTSSSQVVCTLTLTAQKNVFVTYNKRPDGIFPEHIYDASRGYFNLQARDQVFQYASFKQSAAEVNPTAYYYSIDKEVDTHPNCLRVVYSDDALQTITQINAICRAGYSTRHLGVEDDPTRGFNIAAGTYDVYDNGRLKWAVLSDSATLMNPDHSLVQVEAGATVRLDQDGFVTKIEYAKE